MNRRIGCITLIAGLALAHGCDRGTFGDHEPPGPRYGPVSPPVMAWIAANGIDLLRWSDRPLLRGPVELFEVAYGQKHDCPAGCFYSSAYGLRNGDRIGWIKVEDAGDGFNPPPNMRFDVVPADTAVFDAGLWDAVNAVDNWLLRSALAPLLAGDEDTPVEVLRRLSDGLMRDSPVASPYLAWLLLQHPVARRDCAVLLDLSRLPWRQGDLYKPERDLARAWYDSLACSSAP